MTRGVIRALDLRPKAAHYHNGRTGTEDEDFSMVEEECEKCVRAHAVILEQLSVLSKPDLGAPTSQQKTLDVGGECCDCEHLTSA